MNQLREACRVHGRRAVSPARRTSAGRSTNSPAAPAAAGIVFVFSDLLDDVPDILAGLQHLRYQKHEVVLFHTLDAAELDFPFRHTTLFRGLEGLPEILTDPLGVRDSYLKALDEHIAAIEAGCRGDGDRLRPAADRRRPRPRPRRVPAEAHGR